jgi:glycolate oxidase iron-sulfur subunit
MKGYGHRLGTDEARAFSARVLDLAEWLASRGPLPVAPTGRTVVVQDPCHLRHAQRAHGAVREVLAPAFALVEPADDGLCCGAGGAYAVWQPALSAAVRDRKIAALRAAGGADAVVASANPGCLLHLRAGGVDARHPAELLADVLDGGER